MRTSSIHTHAIHPFRISHTDTLWLHRCLSQSTTSCILDPATCLLSTITMCTSMVQLWHICEMPQPLPFSKWAHPNIIVGTISGTHQVPHSPYLADQLSDAYNCYLAIIWESDWRISIKLGCEDRKWAMKNICTLCLYKTENELKLKFKFLGSMDGNNSLKLVDSTYCAGSVQMDSRKLESPRWINPEDVDLFKDKVGKVRPLLLYLTPHIIIILH